MATEWYFRAVFQLANVEFHVLVDQDSSESFTERMQRKLGLEQQSFREASCRGDDQAPSVMASVVRQQFRPAVLAA